MRICLRLDDEIAAVLTTAAKREGLNISQFVSRAIVRDLTADTDVNHGHSQPVAPIAPSPRAGVFLRIQSRELADVQHVSEAAGLSRNQWMLRAIHAALYDQNGHVRPLPEVRTFCRQLLSAIIPIGRNINQAVTKISTIATDRYVSEKDRDELLFWIDQLREMHKEVCAACNVVEAGVSHLAGGNFRYWTARAVEGEAVDAE